MYLVEKCIAHIFLFVLKLGRLLMSIKWLQMDVIILLSRSVHEFACNLAAAFRSYLYLACWIACTLCTLQVEQLSWAERLLAGSGHVTSGLIAIGKRQMNWFPRLPSGSLKRGARATPLLLIKWVVKIYIIFFIIIKRLFY